MPNGSIWKLISSCIQKKREAVCLDSQDVTQRGVSIDLTVNYSRVIEILKVLVETVTGSKEIKIAKSAVSDSHNHMNELNDGVEKCTCSSIVVNESTIFEELKRLHGLFKSVDMENQNNGKFMTIEDVQKNWEMIAEVAEHHGLSIDLITKYAHDILEIISSNTAEYSAILSMIPKINDYRNVLVIGRKWRNLTRAFVLMGKKMFYMRSQSSNPIGNRLNFY